VLHLVDRLAFKKSKMTVCSHFQWYAFYGWSTWAPVPIQTWFVLISCQHLVPVVEHYVCVINVYTLSEFIKFQRGQTLMSCWCRYV